MKPLLALLPDAPRAGKKDDLVAAILRSLSGPGLRALWNRLDTQQLAVAEAAHDPDGVFNGDRFHAKYGRLTALGKSGRRVEVFRLA